MGQTVRTHSEEEDTVIDKADICVYFTELRCFYLCLSVVPNSNLRLEISINMSEKCEGVRKAATEIKAVHNFTATARDPLTHKYYNTDDQLAVPDIL